MKRILSESKAGVWGNAFTTTMTQQQKLALFAVSDYLYFYEPYHEKVDNYCCDSKVWPAKYRKVHSDDQEQL